jgi:hypothetical protein
MKAFYSSAIVPLQVAIADHDSVGLDIPADVPGSVHAHPCHIGARARIAVYDSKSTAPRVLDVQPAPTVEFIEDLASAVHQLCRSEGGSVPYTVIREVAENFIHAKFAEPVVSILDSGSTIRFADQGPGISDKDRALLPGFTTASGDMKRYIRGVGSGLPIVREYLIHSGGSLAIEDNLGKGSVVTVYSGPRSPQSAPVDEAPPVQYAPAIRSAIEPTRQASFVVEETIGASRTASPRLTARQKHVLALVLESGLAGPSLVAKELGVGISTAYRDLALLEEVGLIVSDAGKRTLTEEGLRYLGELMNRS